MRQILIVLALIWAGTAQASKVTITSIDSSWSWDPADQVGAANVGISTDKNDIRWGTPWAGGPVANSVGGNGERSGFGFKQSAEGTEHGVGKSFDVGAFTHFNRVINRGEYMTQATLTMTVKAVFDDMVERTFETSYIFTLWETDNLGQACANGPNGGEGVNRNGCADRVQILQNPSLAETFGNPENGLQYQFELLGFETGSNEFWTVEDLQNTLLLKARFNVVGQPIVTPLPAGAWLLIGGIGALAVLRRRRARA